jgi:hypothetical protein
MIIDLKYISTNRRLHSNSLNVILAQHSIMRLILSKLDNGDSEGVAPPSVLLNDQIYFQAFIRCRISQDPDVDIRVQTQYGSRVYRSGLIWYWRLWLSEWKLSS